MTKTNLYFLIQIDVNITMKTYTRQTQHTYTGLNEYTCTYINNKVSEQQQKT